MHEKIAVIGAGTMGSGIAQIAAEAGYDVMILGRDRLRVEMSIDAIIREYLERKTAAGLPSLDECRDTVSRISGTEDMEEAVHGAAMVIESVCEELGMKQDIFRRLDNLCPEDVILASNTSTLSITDIASVTGHPGRVIGTHYLRPVPLMQLVEIIRGEKTCDEAVLRAVEICKKLGKKPVVVKDIPGFLINRFLCLLYREASDLIEKGLASPEDVETALRLGCNWPIGMAGIMNITGADVIARKLRAM